MAISPARIAAFEILLRVEREFSFASELLHSKRYASPSPSDHALATELVMGVLRWRSCLDDEITAASSQSLGKLDLEVLTALRLGVYQVRWLDRIPARAAIHESVELTKRARKRSAAAFVNAILRRLSQTKFVPESSGGATNETLARDLAHPTWLVERWVREYSSEAARKICRYDQSVPITAIRLRTPVSEAELDRDGVSLEAGALMSSARRVKTGDITRSKAFRDRQVVIQDEASQLVAALVDPVSGIESRILDCCAAPGGKTIAISDRTPQASITALELHPHRAQLLQALVHTANPDAQIHVVAADAQRLPLLCAFDRVLADVPCSGTGTLSRNPEIKWRLRTDDLRDLQSRQLAILRSASAQLAPGGRLVYSTCSLEREENEDVVEQLLTADSSIRRLDIVLELERLQAQGELAWTALTTLAHGPYLRTIPGIHPCDGFFAAILERKNLSGT